MPHRLLLFEGLGGGGEEAWTPLLPTTDGEVSAHSILCPALGTVLYQDTAKTTPAVADGDPVGAYDNQGSDTYAPLQGTTGAKPTLKLNILNGQPILRLDGGDWITGAFGGGQINQPNTVVSVVKLSNASDGSFRLVHDGDDNLRRHAFGQWSISGTDKFSAYAGSVISGTDVDTSWHIWATLYNGGSSQIWDNGISAITGDVGAQNLDGLTVGSRYDGGASWFEGDIAAILIYDAALSDADKNQIGQWAAALYGLSYTDIT